MRFFTVAGLGLIAALAGCATTPQRNSALDDAHVAVAKLAEEPGAAQIASKQLQDARDALAQADSAATTHQRPEEVTHFAYLARRQAELGEATLAEARARAQVAQGEANRNRLLLEAREREVGAAREQTREAQAGAAAAQAGAAAAEAGAAAARESEERARAQLRELQAKQTERGLVLTLGNVLFDTARATLKPGADLVLDRLGSFLQGSPGTKIIVEGHTDSRGSDEYNQQLSHDRARSVLEGLESRGIGADRIQAVGRGKRYPTASNDTPEGRQQNRRVEIVFSDTRGQFAQGAER